MEATGKAKQKWAGSDDLTQLKQRFEQWRGGRKLGARIPAELWDEATRLGVVHGACRVAAELGLDYAVLKRRATGVAPTTSGREVAPPRFVELLAPAGPTAPTTRFADCVVEMDNARGAKMRVELSGNGLGGLAALCSAFWAAR